MNGDELPPPGVDPDILAAALANPSGCGGESDLGCNAYDLWAAMTRLGHEVKLQGRAFAVLREQLANTGAPEADGIRETVSSAVKQAAGVFQEQTRDAERRAEAARQRANRIEEELLAALADVHDRLSRSLETARGNASRKGWIGRLFSRKSGALDSLIEGQELALRRVADELARLDVREIPVLGTAFNPETMRAVATDPSGAAPDGTVTAVLRGGWSRGGGVWRVAEVMVAKTTDKGATW